MHTRLRHSIHCHLGLGCLIGIKPDEFRFEIVRRFFTRDEFMRLKKSGYRELLAVGVKHRPCRLLLLLA